MTTNHNRTNDSDESARYWRTRVALEFVKVAVWVALQIVSEKVRYRA